MSAASSWALGGKYSTSAAEMGIWGEGTLNRSASANQSVLAFQRSWLLLLLSQSFRVLEYTLWIGEIDGGDG